MTRFLRLAVVLLFSPMAGAQPAPAGSRAEVEATLAAMTRAVLAADREAFLSFIPTDDRFFHTEWAHWADQLEKYRPEEFSLTIGDGEATFGPDRAEFPLVMSWRITTGPATSWGAGGKRRTVEFPPVIFTREDPDGDGPLPAAWRFRGERWERLEGDGFGVWYLPGSEKVAKEVAEAFPVARRHDDALFDVSPPPQVLKLFTSMDHLKATVYLNMPDDYLGGWSESGESVKFMTTYTRGVRGWTAAYAHEYGHVCTWELGPHAPRLPWWVQEGVAEMAAMKFRSGARERLDRQMRADAERGRLTPWEELSDYLTTKPPLKIRAYTQGNHMVVYLTDRFGDEARRRWLRLMARDGRPLDEATREALGVSFEDLDRDWRESLRQPAATP